MFALVLGMFNGAGIESFHGRTYDGYASGRLFRMKVNDTLVINFANALGGGGTPFDSTRRVIYTDEGIEKK